MNTTASTQHYHSTINIPPSTRQRPPKQHPHNIIYTTPCMHEKGFILDPPFSSAGKSQKEFLLIAFGQHHVTLSENAIVKEISETKFSPHHFVRFLFFFAILPPPPPSIPFLLLSVLIITTSSTQYHQHNTIIRTPSTDYHQHTISNTPPSYYQEGINNAQLKLVPHYIT